MLVAATGFSFTFELERNGRECFYEKIDNSVSVTVNFQVLSGGNKKVKFEIQTTQGFPVYSGASDTSKKVTYVSKAGETYAFCFENSVSSLSTKSINFELMIRGRVQKDSFASKDDLTPLETQIIALEEKLQEVSKEQKYLKIREARHRVTVNNTNMLAL